MKPTRQPRRQFLRYSAQSLTRSTLLASGLMGAATGAETAATGVPLLLTANGRNGGSGTLDESSADSGGIAHAATNSTRFALIGDTPYGNSEETGLSHVLADAAPAHAFYVHVGDIKSGAEPCTDDLITRRLGLLDKAPRPLVFVPGDNEWTDCSRFYLGNYDPLERLQLLRNLAYANGGTLGRGSLPIESQAPLNEPPATGTRIPEHMRWIAGPCLFVTINVPGSANGLTADLSWSAIRERVKACADWVESSRQVAGRAGIRCLVIVCHAQFIPPLHQTDDGQIDVLDRSRPYAWLRHLMRNLVAGFDGTVVSLHGDGHGYQFEKPWHRNGGHQGSLDGYGVAPGVVAERLDRFVRIRSFGTPLSTAWISVQISRDGDDITVQTTPMVS